MATKTTREPWSHQSSQQRDNTSNKRSRLVPSATTPGAESSSSSDTSKMQAPQLPSAIWGRILDVLPYSDVRRAVAAGKLLAVEAARHVHLLSIYHAPELNVRAARRFCNVSEVNVYSLIRRNEWKRCDVRPGTADSAASSERDPGDCAEWETFCPETARRVVPFLSLFGNLTKCFVGGDRCYTRIYWEPTDPNKEYQTNSAKFSICCDVVQQ